MMDNDDTTNPITMFGISVRLDATLCAPDEVWIEGPDGEAVRVWPPEGASGSLARNTG